jgi:hypothetical protein
MGDDLTTFIVPKVMKNPETLTFWIPKGLFRPVAGKLYIYHVPEHIKYTHTWFLSDKACIFPVTLM